jgi:hypothetical protein
MLIKAKTLQGYTMESVNGEIGTVKEFYFDDRHWAIRYMVADTGNWLSGRQVLISPYSLVATNREEQHIAVNLTKEQIENSPSLERDIPVSQQFEVAYNGYYEWPTYWGGPYMWGAYPSAVEAYHGKGSESRQGEKAWNPHLRSTNEVSSYYIQATDGEIGHVADFVIDDETWAIRYLIIATHNWWPGKKVLVSPRWIERISWEESKVFFSLTREAIKQSPEYTEELLLTRDYEAELHKHYNRQAYWIDEQAAREHSR